MREIIQSSQNPKFKVWKSLLDSKGMKKHHLALVSGQKIVPEICRTDMVQAVLTTENMSSLVFAKDHPEYELLPSLFKELDIYGTQYPILVLSFSALESWVFKENPSALELLVATQDPSNLGAVLRSAEAFHVSKVILLKECAHPYHPKTTRAASGSNWRLALEKGPSIHSLPLKPSLWALDKRGIPLSQTPRINQLLLGEEGLGIPDAIPNERRIQIPMAEPIDSLNAGVAAGICLYHLSENRHK